MSERTGTVVRASDVGQYVYCARAWWLGSVQGLPSAHVEQMRGGEAEHLRHGRQVRSSDRITRLAYGSLALALLAGLLWLIQALVGS